MCGFPSWEYNSNWVTSTAKSVTLTMPSDGNWRFAVRTKDRAGNYQDSWGYTAVVTVDTVAPQTPTATPTVGGVIFSAHDADSGIVAYYTNKIVNGSLVMHSWTDISRTNTLTNINITGLPEGTYCEVYVVDAAGNLKGVGFTTLAPHVHSYVWSEPPTNNRNDCAVAACSCGATTSQPHEWAQLAYRHCNACGSVQGGVGGIPAGTSPVSYCTRCSGFNCGFCSYYNSPYRMGL